MVMLLKIFCSSVRPAVRERSPAAAYNKPTEITSMELTGSKKPKQHSNGAPAGGGREIDLGEHLGLDRELQKELNERIRHRRRSHSMSSRGEKGNSQHFWLRQQP